MERIPPSPPKVSKQPLLESESRAFIPLKERELLPPLPRQVSPEIEKELHIYLNGNKRHITQSISLLRENRDGLGSQLISAGVPIDLLNMIVVECGFNNELKSAMGAVGMWQFMKATARAYGLKVEKNLDQRKDPKLATSAAGRYLSDLYNRYDDWTLAIAAYNAGEGTIDRILKRSKERNFWKLARKGVFRTETVRHVAKFYAVTLIADDPQKYGVQVATG